MALKIDYVARETATNLTRNITLTLASVLTVAVCLTLLGAALMVQSGASNAKGRFEGGIEFIVYLQPQVTEDQRAAIQAALEDNDDIREANYVDKNETYEEFKELFEDTPQLVATVTPEILPPSYRVVPAITDADVVQAIGDQFHGKPGVREVVFAFEAVKKVERTFNKLGNYLLWTALVLACAALLLVTNSIRVAMFARRREIEVMKLVGATNWFIRVPFVVEGVVQTGLGAVSSVGLLTFVVRPLMNDFSKEEILAIFEGFVVTDANLLTANAAVLVFALVIGAIGSAVAVTRFLDV